MDSKALFKLSYGVYLISARGEKDGGCIVNTVTQVTSSPERLMVAVNKDNYTSSLILAGGTFTATVLTEDTDMNLIAGFGFRSGRDADKFADFPELRDINGNRYVEDTMAALYSCRVVGTLDAGSHTLFLGQLEDARVLSGAPPMTYSYYHQVKNGATPKNAPSYQAPAEDGETGFRCSVCGHIERVDSLPDDYICPVCGQPKSAFVKL